MKLIPIYTENIKGRQNYTFFIDKQTNLIFKAYHKDNKNQSIYGIGFVLVLAIFRYLKEVDLHFLDDFNLSIIIAVCIIGFFSAKFYYQKYAYEPIKEVYLTQTMLDEYIEKGRKVFILEIWIAIISLLIFLFLALLYYFTSSLVVLIFSLFDFWFLTMYLFRLPKERFMIYKKSIEKEK